MSKRNPALAALAAARRDSPPVKSRRSVLDRDDVNELLEDWMKAKAKGAAQGESFAWMADKVLPKLKVKTTAGNLRLYCRGRWPDLYERVAG